LSYRPARLGIDSWAPEKVYKYRLRLHRLAKSILGLKSLKIPSLAGQNDNPIPTRFLAPIDCPKLPALLYQANGDGRSYYVEPIKTTSKQVGLF
jgi:hypothetical protein